MCILRAMPAGSTPPDSRPICVTGASGFVGSHVLRELLARGYNVRGTVRSLRDPAKTEHLRRIASELGAESCLELFAADLSVEGAFDEVLDGCRGLCHVASAAKLTADDPQREIIDVAVEGTKNVLRSAAKAKVERVILTSSIAAVIDERKGVAHTHTEEDWNEERDISRTPYTVSKALAERAAWELQAALPEDERFSMAAINPTVVLGPVYAEVHVRTTPALLCDLMRGKMPGTPKFFFSIVDVRDVAAAHVNALERPELEGRFILYNQGMWLKDIATTLRGRWADKPIPKRSIPNFVMYAFAMFDQRLNFAFLRRNLDVVRRIDASRSKNELGIDYRPIGETIIDSGQSFVDLGLA